MKSSWTSKPLAALIALFLFLGPLAAQDTATVSAPKPEAAGDEETKAEDMARAMKLGLDLERAMRLLRAYRPEAVHEHLKTSELPKPLIDLLTGWAWHQQGNYDKASESFEKVEPDMLEGDNYLAGRLVELRKTAQALKEFETEETENFSIRYKPGSDRVLLNFLPDVLERTYARFSALFDFERDEDKIIVELMPDHNLFSYASALTRQQIETTGTIALCVENRLVVLTPRRVLMGYYWPDVIAHEFIHYILTKHSADHAPLWLQEGVAKYFEARWEREDVNPLDPSMETSMALAIKEDSLITVEQMMPSFAALPTAALARQAYAQTTTMVDYLSKEHGENIISRIVLGLGENGDLDEVMEAMTGKDFETFESNWREWIKTQGYRVRADATAAQGVNLLDEDMPEEEIKAVEDADQAYKKHVRLGDLLLERNRYRGALRQYQKIPTRGGKYSRQVLLRMVTCHHFLENHREIIRLIDFHVPNLENDTTMLVKKAEALLGVDNGAEAKGLLDRCIRINPFNPLIYKMLLNLETGEDEAAVYRECLEILTNPGAVHGKERKS
ncbi:MAG: peptidase MA family metallohydrolase [Acidobacteriota bacterium]|nr:peptidase MA family metallohydrolase [Acidobacteriota bacterium]